MLKDFIFDLLDGVVVEGVPPGEPRSAALPRFNCRRVLRSPKVPFSRTAAMCQESREIGQESSSLSKFLILPDCGHYPCLKVAH